MLRILKICVYDYFDLEMGAFDIEKLIQNSRKKNLRKMNSNKFT